MKPTKEQNDDWLAFDKSFESGLELPDDDEEPETTAQWGHENGWEVAGNGKITNPDPNDPKACGKFYGHDGCLHVENHNITTLDGKNHRGKIYGRKRFRYCDNPRCPTCSKLGYSVREARIVTERLEEGSKKYGAIEHVIISGTVEAKLNMDYDELHGEVRDALDHRGILGGVLIFHAFRYNNAEEARRKGVLMGWYWSPHFHCLCFIDGGYGKCRGCSNLKSDGNIYSHEKCLACGSFEGRSRKCWEKDGYICKVKGARKTVFGTAWYQLNHASIKSDAKHFRIPRWFGVVSYRKLKLAKSDRRIEKRTCPLCGEYLEHIKYVGAGEPYVAGQFWIKEFEDEYLDGDGRPKWIPKPSVR
jgi:hypothetical protein